MVEDLQDPRRTEPPYRLGEREMLEAWLEFHRTTLELKCEGLDDVTRKLRPVPTSNLSLHGLLRHMAEVERNWFRRVLLRAPTTSPIWYDPAVEDSELVPLDDADWPSDLATWHAECKDTAARSGRARPRRHRVPPRRGGLAAVDLRAHDRGVHAPQRAHGPHPRAARRHRRLVAGPARSDRRDPPTNRAGRAGKNRAWGARRMRSWWHGRSPIRTRSQASTSATPRRSTAT